MNLNTVSGQSLRAREVQKRLHFSTLFQPKTCENVHTLVQVKVCDFGNEPEQRLLELDLAKSK